MEKIKIAKELVRIAKSLVAFLDPIDNSDVQDVINSLMGDPNVVFLQIYTCVSGLENHFKPFTDWYDYTRLKGGGADYRKGQDIYQYIIDSYESGMVLIESKDDVVICEIQYKLAGDNEMHSIKVSDTGKKLGGDRLVELPI